MSDALEKGIALGKANRRTEAIEYLKQALIENPREVEAWMWISQLVDDRPTQKYCFQKILKIDPEHFMAKQFLGFLKDTDANLKFFPEPISPLQTFFENQQGRQPQIKAGIPFPVSAARPNLNMHPTIAPLQNSRPARPQNRPKKKGISPWITSFLVFTIIIIVLSISVPLVGTPLIPYLPVQEPPISADVLVFGGLFLAWSAFLILISLYWVIPGYVGAYFLIKKGYILELVGCAILAAGLPLLLPAVLGPIMYWWGKSVHERNR